MVNVPGLNEVTSVIYGVISCHENPTAKKTILKSFFDNFDSIVELQVKNFAKSGNLLAAKKLCDTASPKVHAQLKVPQPKNIKELVNKVMVDSKADIPNAVLLIALEQFGFDLLEKYHLDLNLESQHDMTKFVARLEDIMDIQNIQEVAKDKMTTPRSIINYLNRHPRFNETA